MSEKYITLKPNSLRTVHFFLLASMLTLAGCTGIPYSEHEVTSIYVGWACYDADELDASTPFVSLYGHHASRTGNVNLSGIKIETYFYIDGLEYRWSWDDAGGRHSFIVDTDGIARYYDFGREDTAKPSAVYACIRE
ncbi:MAG: hypothetical protein F4239_07635 [Gammaproteobacteria bacterium]|nr:hypothetical protein [Gammaproteobacteria bacterium]